MKKLLSLALAGFLAAPLAAQQLPQPSPAATTKQTVGLTEITINYSRPSLKGRKAFGEMVAYDKLWRTGANMATTIEFSTDLTFGDTPVGAGKYSLYAIPGEKEWTIILNKATNNWGTGGYKEELDIARVVVRAETIPTKETFEISIDRIVGNEAQLVLAWENVAAKVALKVETAAQAESNIQAAIAAEPENAMVYRNAASYYMQNKINLDRAETYMEKSIALKGDNWYSRWLMAEVKAENGKNKEAVLHANWALALGQAAAEKSGEPFAYSDMIAETIAKWGGKVKKPKELK
ncbi:MAG: DUF2911 domain-containing protein [Schleiferiaceae bacterium]|nr:DUF2911 domain-containing protein [Schleiferiaceae bacterium]